MSQLCREGVIFGSCRFGSLSVYCCLVLLITLSRGFPLLGGEATYAVSIYVLGLLFCFALTLLQRELLFYRGDIVVPLPPLCFIRKSPLLRLPLFPHMSTPSASSGAITPWSRHTVADLETAADRLFGSSVRIPSLSAALMSDKRNIVSTRRATGLCLCCAIPLRDSKSGNAGVTSHFCQHCHLGPVCQPCSVSQPGTDLNGIFGVGVHGPDLHRDPSGLHLMCRYNKIELSGFVVDRRDAIRHRPPPTPRNAWTSALSLRLVEEKYALERRILSFGTVGCLLLSLTRFVFGFWRALTNLRTVRSLHRRSTRRDQYLYMRRVFDNITVYRHPLWGVLHRCALNRCRGTPVFLELSSCSSCLGAAVPATSSTSQSSGGYPTILEMCDFAEMWKWISPYVAQHRVYTFQITAALFLTANCNFLDLEIDARRLLQIGFLIPNSLYDMHHLIHLAELKRDALDILIYLTLNKASRQYICFHYRPPADIIRREGVIMRFLTPRAASHAVPEDTRPEPNRRMRRRTRGLALLELLPLMTVPPHPLSLPTTEPDAHDPTYMAQTSAWGRIWHCIRNDCCPRATVNGSRTLCSNCDAVEFSIIQKVIRDPSYSQRSILLHPLQPSDDFVRRVHFPRPPQSPTRFHVQPHQTHRMRPFYFYDEPHFV